MATMTASLERSLQNCSLNQSSITRSHRSTAAGGGGGGGGTGGRTRRSSSSLSDSPPENTHNHHHHNQYHDDEIERPHRNNHQGVTNSNASSSDDNSTFVDLNSHVSLPYHWEQCLDLKTGELYYINWSTGAKAKEDPRTTATGYNGDYYSEEDENDDDNDNDDDDDEDESSPYESEGSSTAESSPCSSTRERFRTVKRHQPQQPQQQQQQALTQDSVLVVAGCKSCFMYYMVPKHVDECLKCSGQLLHFAANN